MKEFPEEEKNNLKERLNIKNNDVVLVTTSRLVLKNGVKDAIKSVSLLPLNYKFLILGEGDLRAELETLVGSLTLNDRVKFLGFVSHDQIPLYFSVSDIFIRTSLSEGLGNSFLEAMAFGLPVVATPVGGILDFLKDGETGILVKPEDTFSIKEGILSLEDENFKNSIKYNAKDLVLNKYNWEIISKDFDNLLENI
ncbi:MAG: glycosyltransferase family 4 protein [Candidatus Paceibacterota bacterium]